MLENQNTISEQAELTGEVEKIVCDNCFEEYLFALKDNTHEFSIGLISILQCLAFAENEGAVPELPSEWWLEVKNHFQI